MTSGSNGRGATYVGRDVGQSHENDFAKTVVVCKPALPKMMGTLHPAGSLYEKPVNTEQAKQQHANFREKMESHGIKVFDVWELLMMDAEDNVNARVQLEDFALRSLAYYFDESSTSDASKEDLYYVGDAYKRKTIEEMSSEQLVDIILTRPTVKLMKSYRDTGFTASYAFQPLANIVFTRDQQVTTNKGIVMARLASEQRMHEVDVMQFCFEKLGVPVIGRIPSPGTLEGGDFFPVGDDLCMVGTGLRTNQAAVDYMLENDLFGTRRVAVVRDEFDRCQDRLHLDTVFNILSPTCCIALEDMLGQGSDKKRLVDEYIADDAGKYSKAQKDVELSEYLIKNGFNIIPVKAEDQLCYGCNVLNLGGGTLIAVNKKVARQIVRSKHFNGRIEFVDFSSITAMYGAVHCASQVIYRSKS
eukprot:Plantae.Rhodophyta-Purpureofilum_apyrenoidigerum.ctg16859.p1 GENE.Plantae.Rhodophyta-Purpureofilum_apyrenoidigerum.ctg16859~~Plantae.Rhodophyta-Purpureofilum_apyrenoidigerum.ctg16859.p1  ORF type:complete len:437 (-),score=92.87 Plantae.Rhodophyta-Purpureofilum_apyrenoidigerum.ctg16859:255-1502(-)